MEKVAETWDMLMKLCEVILGGLSGFVDDMLNIITEEVKIAGTEYSVISLMIGGLAGVLITKTLVKWVIGL